MFELAFARGFSSVKTTAGHVRVMVSPMAWWSAWRAWVQLPWRPASLEISGQQFSLLRARRPAVALSRAAGDRFSVVWTAVARFRNRALTIPRNGAVISLPFFGMGEVRRACLATG